MEFSKKLPSIYSYEPDDLVDDIAALMQEFKSNNINESSLGLTNHQILGLADPDMRKEILEDVKKRTKLFSATVEKTPLMPRSHEVKSKIFNLPCEDPHISSKNFDLYRLKASCSCILGIIAMGCAAINYDLEYIESNVQLNYSAWIRLTSFGTVATILLLLSIISRKYAELKWEQSKNIFTESDGLRSSSKMNSLIIELVLNSLHPIWYLNGQSFEYYNNINNQTVCYSYNSMLSIISIVKLSHIFRLFLLESKYYSGRAHRVCKINAISPGKVWTCRCIMIMHPFKVFIGMLVSGICILGYCLRIFERPFAVEGLKNGFDQFGNCAWCILVTMTTVGFGDLYPKSIPGRLVGVIACIWGVFVISLVVVGVTHKLDFDPGQIKSYTLHQRLEFKNIFRRMAATVLRNAFKFKVIMKNKSAIEKDIKLQQSKYKRNIIEFQKAKLKSNIIYGLHSSEAKIEKRINEASDLAIYNLKIAKETWEKLNSFKEMHECS